MEKIMVELMRLFRVDQILVDELSKQIYGSDLTQSQQSNPIAIVFPDTEQQVIELVQFANAAKIALVPSGGRTGYSGGAVAACGEIVVSFEKMNRIREVNVEDKILRCEPGVTIKTLKEVAEKHQLFYPIDFASIASCQIGGSVATNAGGIHVIHYGVTRNWVCGLRVVTGNGDLLDLNRGLKKNAAGYDFSQLWVGSEGTLGLITEVSVRLARTPPKTATAIFSVSQVSDLKDILSLLNRKVEVLAFEMFSDRALAYVMTENLMEAPFAARSPIYGVLEYAAEEQEVGSILKDFYQKGVIHNYTVSENRENSEKIWSYRKLIAASLSRHQPYKYDIGVLPSRIPEFMQDVDLVFQTVFPDLDIIWFGHVGDGNLHLNILKPTKICREEFYDICKEVSQYVYQLIQKYHGTVSAEHGVGLEKKEFLHFSRSEKEIEYMKKIKKIFDENNILNPGKIF